MFASNSWGRAYPMLQVGQIFFSENLKNIAMLLGGWRPWHARSSHLPPAKERIMTLKRANVDNKLVFLLTLINLFVWPILNTFQDRFRGFRSHQTNLDSFVALFSSACLCFMEYWPLVHPARWRWDCCILHQNNGTIYAGVIVTLIGPYIRYYSTCMSLCWLIK